MGEFLAKVSQSDVEGLLGVARNIAAQVAPEVIKHEVTEQGFAHVFPDGTEIEVGGALFEGAGRSYGADKALLMRSGPAFWYNKLSSLFRHERRSWLWPREGNSLRNLRRG